MRVVKTVLIHMGLLISSVLLILAETKFVTHRLRGGKKNKWIKIEKY